MPEEINSQNYKSRQDEIYIPLNPPRYGRTDPAKIKDLMNRFNQFRIPPRER